MSAFQCGLTWLRFEDAEGEHWARCQLRDGHTTVHRDGAAWLFVGDEPMVTHEWILTNLERAAAIIAEIEQVRAVQRELRSAFAGSELDGGAKAAVEHPLYQDATRRLAALHEALMLLI